jgi:hypothetical protein
MRHAAPNRSQHFPADSGVHPLCCILAGLWVVYGEAPTDASGDGVAPSVAVSRPPLLDWSKPVFIRAGSMACPSMEELEAEQRNTPNACDRMPTDWLVAQMESHGILTPIDRVRPYGMGKVVADVWVSESSLRN